MEFPLHIPFLDELGFELVSMGGGEAELAVTLREGLCNAFAVAHGGLLMTLLDAAMAHAARSAAASPAESPSGPGLVTIEMKTSFLEPGRGRLRARGQLLQRTATLAFCEGSVIGPEGRLCARASGTFKVLRALPPSRRPTP